ADLDFFFQAEDGIRDFHVTRVQTCALPIFEKKNALVIDIKGKDNFTTAITESSKTSYWNIFALGFIGGLIALLTPCVFPMIPLTVSFFTKRSTNRQKGISNAILYGAFIVIIYLLLSLPFHLMDSLDPEILNNIST